MDEITREYMAMIGSKGGAAGKGTKLRAKLNKRAARIRWNNHKSACTAKLQSSEAVNISPNKSPMKPLA